MADRTPDVLVIGGGLAGLSAAVELYRRGRSVLLVEQRRRFGGRAYSIPHPETGMEMDNGQHLMLGCYHSTFRYLRTIGRDHLVDVQSSLSILFRHPHRAPTRLTAGPLPAPLHVLVGLLRLDHLSLRQRLSLLRVGADLLTTDPFRDPELRSLTVAQWLERRGQPAENRTALWDIIAIGALNDTTDRISAALFVHILRTAFFGKRRNASMAIPKMGLSTIFVDGAVEYLRNCGSDVRLETAVEQVEFSGNAVASVRFSDGSTVRPKAVVSAVPYFDLPKVFGSAEALGLQGLDAFISSPIVTIHCWFDAHFMPEPFAALVGSPFHWVFNRNLITGSGGTGLMYLAVVVSAAHEVVEMEKESLVSLVHTELQRYYPAAAVARVVHAQVVKEKRATFSPRVGLENVRPGPRTKYTNLFLAGDWTDTSFPATIEGAILSGETAAAAVIG